MSKVLAGKARAVQFPEKALCSFLTEDNSGNAGLPLHGWKACASPRPEGSRDLPPSSLSHSSNGLSVPMPAHNGVSVHATGGPCLTITFQSPPGISVRLLRALSLSRTAILQRLGWALSNSRACRHWCCSGSASARQRDTLLTGLQACSAGKVLRKWRPSSPGTAGRTQLLRMA